MYRQVSIAIGLLISSLVLILAGCGDSEVTTTASLTTNQTSEQSTSTSYTDILSIGAASAGGGYYVVAGALSTVLADAGISSRAQTTGGGRQNAILADLGEVDLGLTNNIEAYEEWDKNDRTHMRSLFPIFNGLHHFIVKADLPINTLADLADYRYGLTAKGSTHDTAGRQIFQILGIEPKSLTNASKADTNSMVRDGLLAGYFITSGIPVSTVSELETSKDLRFLGFTDEEYEKVREQAPWLSEDVIPAGSYKGLEQDVKTFSSWNVVVANENLPDDLVYAILEAVFANAQQIQDTYASADIDPALLDKLVIPLHPGAVKYYQDNGFTVPASLLP